MPRIDQLTEHLITHPGTSLSLDSETPGFYVDDTGVNTPVFRQPLRSGQILLLFADLVPKEKSQDFLAGKPTDFVFETRRGTFSVHMEMLGSELRTRVKLARAGDELLRSMSSESSIIAPPPPPPGEAPRANLVSLIARLPEHGISHLHLTADRPALVRVAGVLRPWKEGGGPFTASELREALLALAPQALKDDLGKRAFEFSHVARDAVFHVRGQLGREGLAVVIRALPRVVESPTSLGLPEDFLQVLRGAGLWIIAGGAGQGTSTTVASLTQAALLRHPMTVCTYESPIDYLLEPGRGFVRQLEIGVHTPSFAQGLAEARRGDDDLIVVGQLDDASTLEAALGLAERGRLVIGVLHAKTALSAVQKLLDLVPGRAPAVASVFRGVFAQQLVPNLKQGRSLSWELLPGSDAVRGFLRDGAVTQLPALLTRSFDQSLMQLLVHGSIDAEVALAHAQDRSWFEAQLSRVAHPRAA